MPGSSRLKSGSNLLIIAGSVFLAAYLALLIALVFLGQAQLRELTRKQAWSELEKQAAVIGYFFDEQKDAIGELAADRSVEVYLSNQALGMSMKHGLKASLLQVVKRMHRLKARKRIRGQVIYKRIALFDVQGRALAGDDAKSLDDHPWNGPIPTLAAGVSLIDNCGTGAGFGCLVAPVTYKGHLAGFVVAEFDLPSALALLVEPAGQRDSLIRQESGVVLFPVENRSTGDSPGWRLQKTIPGTTLTLEKHLGPRDTNNYLTSPQLPWGLSLLALPLLLGLGSLLRLNNHNLVLRTQNEMGAAQRELLRRQRDAKSVVSDAAARLLEAPLGDMDQAVDLALRISGEHLHADRAYLFLYADNGSRFSNTHEWCAPGIEPQKDNAQEIPSDATPWWWQQMAGKGVVLVPEVAGLPPEAATEKGIFESQAIQSLFAVPLQKADKTFGFIGYDSVTRRRDWSEEEIQLLSLIGGLVSSALARWEAEASLETTLGRLHEAERIGRTGSWTHDLATGEVVWSPGEFGVQGVSTDVPPAFQRQLDAMFEQDREDFESTYRANLASRDTEFIQEYRLRRGGGETRHILTRYRVKRDDSGRALAISGTDQDITERKQVEEALQEAMASREAILSAVPDLLFELDGQGRYLNLWAQNPEELAAGRDQLLGRTVRDLLSSESADGVMQAIHEAMAGGHSRGQQIWLDTPLGEQCFELSTSRMGQDPAQPRVVMLSRNITERKRAEQRLQLAAGVFTHAREGIAITDVRGNIVDVNGAFTAITGYTLEEVSGVSLLDIKGNAREVNNQVVLWTELDRDGHWSGEFWSRRKDGTVYAETITISAVGDDRDESRHYVALFSDITVQKKHQIQLEHIAHHDALTNMPNRMLLADRLLQAMAQAERRHNLLAVAYLDLDGFKQINDEHGHDVGDAFLVAVAHRMKDTLRQVDTFARLGGDEFVAVMVDLPEPDACASQLNRLLAVAAQPLVLKNRLLRVSASIGVTFYPQSRVVDADQLLRQADQAMYQAKLSGKNRFQYFDAQRDHQVRTRHESLASIRRGLSAGEFRLYYQPLVNMRSGAVVGAEALIRWQNPERGLLLPSDFLPTIANNPLAAEVDLWVIDAVLSQLDAWRGRDVIDTVSVNVGAELVQRGDFVTELRSLLERHPKVEAGALELEILETSALEDMAQVTRVMQDCGELGIRFALDDFGTGYSSLTYLKRLPATRLKVDQSFVQNMYDAPEDLSIVEGVLSLADAFNRQAVAEGVETRAHAEILLQLGCELAQGYHFARPMPADEIPEWRRRRRVDATLSGVRPLDRIGLRLLLAGVEHRAWFLAVESHVRGHLGVQERAMELTRCRFGRWLEGEGRLHFEGDPAFEMLSPLHRRAHELAEAVLDLHARGDTASAIRRLQELATVRDQLLQKLHALTLDAGREGSSPWLA